MPINNASKFIAKVYERDEAALALLPEGVSPEGIGAEEITAIAKAANSAGWEFTADELQEAYLSTLVLDECELTSVAGGVDIVDPVPAKHPGGCSSNYYAEQCGATWETGSLCACTDYKDGRTVTPV